MYETYTVNALLQLLGKDIQHQFTVLHLTLSQTRTLVVLMQRRFKSNFLRNSSQLIRLPL